MFLGSFNMALLQLDTQDDKAANLKRIGEMIDEAAGKRAQFVCMPEMANYIGIGDGPFQNAEDVPGGPTADLFRDKAKQHGIWIHGGSIPERIAGEKRVYNTTVVFNPKGEIVAKYRKIHLYDAYGFTESRTVAPGLEPVVIDVDGVGLQSIAARALAALATTRARVARRTLLVAGRGLQNR